MLEVEKLSVAYGQHPALNEVSLQVGTNEIVVILGANGAGKSTLLKAVSGICEGAVNGSVKLNGVHLDSLPADEIVPEGLALVPEGRGIFPELTVLENLRLGAYTEDARASATENMMRVYELFPKLRERGSQRAGTMSGGEQQMVAIGRAMMSNPKILMLDEPSLGLSPLLTKELFQNLKRVKQFGLGILMVEQNAKQSLAISDRGYLLENTRIIKEDKASNLLSDPSVQAAYLGGAGQKSKASSRSKPTADKTETATSQIQKTGVAKEPLQHVDVGYASKQSISADQVLGRSISDLVAQANDISRGSVTSSYQSKTAAPTKVMPPSDQVERVYHDIEQAAARALDRRRRAPVETRTSSVAARPTATATQAASNGSEPQKPVKIEIYRAPRVEVYRRRGEAQEMIRDDRG